MVSVLAHNYFVALEKPSALPKKKAKGVLGFSGADSGSLALTWSQSATLVLTVVISLIRSLRTLTA
jgi:hypothetical protein